jgi:hypothetical protein
MHLRKQPSIEQLQPFPIRQLRPIVRPNIREHFLLEILTLLTGPAFGTAARFYAQLADYDYLAGGLKYRDTVRDIFERTARGIPEFEKNL